MPISSVSNNNSSAYSLNINSQGNPVFEDQDKFEVLQKHEAIGNNSHKYYRYELNKITGPAGITGLYSTLAAAVMWHYERGPAATTNVLVALAQFAQVFLARTPLLGNPDHTDAVESKIAKERREGVIAWVQGIAGLGGLMSFVYEYALGKERDIDVSTVKKSLLSASALGATALGLASYMEKTIASVTGLGKKKGNESKGMKLNAHSDLRAAIQDVLMAVYPWVTGIKPLKVAMDLIIPLHAIRDGVMHFVQEGMSKVFMKESNKHIPEKAKSFLKKVFFIGESVDDKAVAAPLFMKSKLLMGSIRDKIILPVLKFLDCRNAPKVAVAQDRKNTFMVESPLVAPASA